MKIRRLKRTVVWPAVLIAGLLPVLATIDPMLRYADLVAAHNHWQTWPLSPGITLAIITVALLYAAGSRDNPLAIRDRHAVFRHLSYFGGLASIFLALQSPIEEVADHVFLVHEVEHMLLGLVGPMLIMASAPQAPLLRGLPDWARRRAVSPLFASRWIHSFSLFRHPVVATALYIGATYFWMIPRWHNLAILNEEVHYLWHASLLTSGLIFFWCLLDPRPQPFGASFGARLFMIWFASMGHLLLGAFLSFKNAVLYSAYGEIGRWWGIGPLADERFGGLTMWIPGCMMLAATGLLVIFRWVGQEERRSLRSPALLPSSAELRLQRRAANRALAIGLLLFAGTGLAITLGTAIAYRYSAVFAAL